MERFKEEEAKVIDDYFKMHDKVYRTGNGGLIPPTATDIELDTNNKDIKDIVSPIIIILKKEIQQKYKHQVDYHTYKVTISKSFVFDACHYLPYHDRRCKYLHGHTYHMEIGVKGSVNPETGMVMDYGELKKIVEEKVIDQWDHGFINEQIPYPTAELMCLYTWNKLMVDVPDLTWIKIWETDGSCAEITRADIEEIVHA